MYGSGTVLSSRTRGFRRGSEGAWVWYIQSNVKVWDKKSIHDITSPYITSHLTSFCALKKIGLNEAKFTLRAVYLLRVAY